MNPNIAQLAANPKLAAQFVSSQIGEQRRYARCTSARLYSAHLIPATAQADDYRVFNTGYGQVGQGYANGLTWRETNIPTSGTLPSETDYIAFSVGLSVAEEKLIDAVNGRPFVMKDFFGHAVPWLDQPGYKHTFGVGFMLPSGSGVYGYSVENNASIMTNGVPGSGARYQFAVPIVLKGGSSMGVSIRLTGADGFTALTNEEAFDAWVDFFCLEFQKVSIG